MNLHDGHETPGFHTTGDQTTRAKRSGKDNIKKVLVK